MKAAVYHRYGDPDVLNIEEVTMPAIEPGEVLVRVMGTAVNPGDWDLLHGWPYLFRLMTGLRRPRKPVLGFAIAGRVEEAGVGVTGLRPGDPVYGEVAEAGFAEYACVPADALAPKPRNLSFEEAAAVPVAGVTALQALRDVGRVTPGDRVLINGASGGVGTFAVQIAKSLGAEVTGVCGPGNVELVRSLGADHVIDYSTEDFTEGGPRFDVVFDNVGNRSLSAYRRALAPGGTLIPNSNKGPGHWLGGFLRRAVQALVISPFVPQRLRPFAATGSAADLSTLTDLIERGEVTPVVDGTYPFDDAAEALRHYGTGHSRGRVVVAVGSDPSAGGSE